MRFKYKKIILPILAGYFLSGCSYSYYKYIQEGKNVYKYSNAGHIIETNLATTIHDIEKPGKIELSFWFAENLIRAQNLKSIDLKLYTKEGNESKYTKEIPII